jgi:hypothetical protein
MDDGLEARTAAIADALQQAKPALEGAVCANCAFRAQHQGRLSCGLKGGPRHAETIRPAETCDAFTDAHDQRADDDGMTSAAAPPATKPKDKDKVKRSPRAERGGGDGRTQSMVVPLPEDCPVKPLGHMGQTYYYLSAANQLEEVPAEKHGRLVLLHLFGGRADYMTSWLPAFNAKGVITGPKNEIIQNSLLHACYRRGLWDKRDRVRGRGCWSGETGLVMHLGRSVVTPEAVHEPGEIGDHVYPAGGRLLSPGDDARHPGADILAQLNTWNWRRPHLDPLLLLGWCGAGLLGASLSVRPMVYITGGHGSGKSTLNKLLELLLGKWLLWSNDATQAAVTSTLGLDCLPVAENESRPDSKRAEGMIELARLSYSGGTKRRGSANHEAHEFTVRSAMLFSAINPPAMEPQDKSRFAVLKLGSLDPLAPRLVLNAAMLHQLGARMLARLNADQGAFQARFDALAEALRKAGHSARGQDTFGTLLACAWTLIGDDDCDRLGLPLASRLKELTLLMRADELAETAGKAENWRECLDHLLDAPVEAWRNNKRQTIGAVLDGVLDKIKNAENDGISFSDAVDLLKQAGVRLMKPDTASDPLRVFIPHKSEQLARLFKGSKWAGIPGEGGWSQALEQAPAQLWRREVQRVNKPVRGLSFTISTMMEDEPPENTNPEAEAWA